MTIAFILAVAVTALAEWSGRARGLVHSTTELSTTALWAGASLLYFYALADAVKRPAQHWTRSHLSKLMWVSFLTVVPWASLVAYILYARPRLERH